MDTEEMLALLADLREAREEVEEMPADSHEFCLNCREIHLSTDDAAQACYDADHPVVHADYYNNGIFNWIDCLEYVLADEGMECPECGETHLDWTDRGRGAVDDGHNEGFIYAYECGKCGGIAEVPRR